MTVQAGRIARERDRAENEAAKATAVSRFMRETLSAASPFEQGIDITVTEALDQATTRISPSFADQPEVEAEVRHTIGDTYNTLGRYDEAQPLLESALEMRAGLMGTDSPEAIETMAVAGPALLAEGGLRRGHRTRLRTARGETADLRRPELGCGGDPGFPRSGADRGRPLRRGRARHPTGTGHESRTARRRVGANGRLLPEHVGARGGLAAGLCSRRRTDPQRDRNPSRGRRRRHHGERRRSQQPGDLHHAPGPARGGCRDHRRGERGRAAVGGRPAPRARQGTREPGQRQLPARQLRQDPRSAGRGH